MIKRLLLSLRKAFVSTLKTVILVLLITIVGFWVLASIQSFIGAIIFCLIMEWRKYYQEMKEKDKNSTT